MGDEELSGDARRRLEAAKERLAASRKLLDELDAQATEILAAMVPMGRRFLRLRQIRWQMAMELEKFDRLVRKLENMKESK